MRRSLISRSGNIDLGKGHGGNLYYGGNAVLPESGGYHIEPTIFENVDNAMRIARDGIFGPVLSVIDYEDAADAGRIASDTDYRLAGVIRTCDLVTAHRVANAVCAGVVWVTPANDDHIGSSFDRFKQSGLERDESVHSLEKCGFTNSIRLQVD